ncbi:unnamed protein product [Durusdinium trenchii]|uniref:PDZ domain-containing protein n=1 Tax=Durusdinium trenchii TaxID=1381693 RepID=A0ABP0LSF2_9DINO
MLWFSDRFLPCCICQRSEEIPPTELRVQRLDAMLDENRRDAPIDLPEYPDLALNNDGFGMCGLEQFRVSLDKEAIEEAGLGLDFDTTQREVCVVVRIDPHGEAARWNASRLEKIRVHDRLVAVNHQFLPAVELWEKLQACASSRLELIFERPDIYSFKFNRSDGKVGLSLAVSKVCPVLIIKGVDPDGVMSQKVVEDGDKRPRPQDRILQVNGEQFDSTRMAKQLSANKVSLTACRYNV